MSKARPCPACGAGMVAKRGEWKDYALPGVTLVGIPVYRCPACGETAHGVERADELHQMITGAVIEKRGRLTPAEVRFLRSFLEMSSGDLARHMGTSLETVSRWENGAKQMGRVADRLLRALVALHAQLRYPLEAFAGMAQGKARPLRLQLRRVPGRGWQRDGQRRAA